MQKLIGRQDLIKRFICWNHWRLLYMHIYTYAESWDHVFCIGHCWYHCYTYKSQSKLNYPSYILPAPCSPFLSLFIFPSFSKFPFHHHHPYPPIKSQQRKSQFTQGPSLKTKQQFVPPNPKLFVIAIRTIPLLEEDCGPS